METIATMTDRVLRFPRELLERAGLAATTQVKIRVHNGGLLIEPTEAAAQPRRSHPVMAAQHKLQRQLKLDLEGSVAFWRRATQAQSLWSLALFISAGLAHGQSLRAIMTPLLRALCAA